LKVAMNLPSTDQFSLTFNTGAEQSDGGRGCLVSV
jgi:hypothetical protein